MDAAEIDRLEARGLACLDSGSLEESLACFRTVIEARRTDGIEASLKRLARAFVESAMRGVQDASAEQAYRRCIEAYMLIGEAIDSPADRTLLMAASFNLGVYWQKFGDEGKAVLHYRDALMLQPGEENAAANLSTLLLRCGRAREALTVVRDALAVSPDSPGLVANLILCLYETGEVGAAVRETEEAARRFPDMRFQYRACFYRTGESEPALTA